MMRNHCCRIPYFAVMLQPCVGAFFTKQLFPASVQDLARIGFKGMEDIMVEGVLNVGVNPKCGPKPWTSIHILNVRGSVSSIGFQCAMYPGTGEAPWGSCTMQTAVSGSCTLLIGRARGSGPRSAASAGGWLRC